MAVKTSLSFTDRYRPYLIEKVREGVYASSSAAVAAAPRPPALTYRVLRHLLVASDLEAILRMTTDHAGADVALARFDDIERRMRALAETPHVGGLCDETLPGLRALPAARKGAIDFRVDDAARQVFVLCVVHAGSDWVSRAARRGR